MLKKLLVLLVLSIASFFSCKGQTYNFKDDDDPDGKVHIGIKAGINISGFTKNVGMFDKNTPGYASGLFGNARKDIFMTGHFGLTADYQIRRSLSISVEAIYNGRGDTYKMENQKVLVTDTDGTQKNATDEYTFDFYYLEIPLLVQYHIPANIPDVSLRLYGGIAPGFNMSSRAAYHHYSIADNGTDVNETTDESNLSNVKKYQVSPILGFWAYGKLDNLPMGFFGDIRFQFFSSSVFNTVGNNSPNWSTSVWNVNFSMGVRF